MVPTLSLSLNLSDYGMALIIVARMIDPRLTDPDSDPDPGRIDGHRSLR